MIPNTYLLTAPKGAPDSLGTTMLSGDLIKGLRRCNSNLHTPDPSVFTWYPGKATGQTSLWEGEPLKGRKITTFHLGAIPEWTHLDPKGLLVARGWRDILWRVIRAKSVSKRVLEREFKVNLGLHENDDGTCRQCRREGKGAVQAWAASGYCDTHDKLTKQISRNQRVQQDAPQAAASFSSFQSRQPHTVS